MDRVEWTPELTAKIEELIRSKDRFMESDLYWISKIMPLPLLKERFIETCEENRISASGARARLSKFGGNQTPRCMRFSRPC